MNQHHSYAVIWDVDGTLVDTAELHFYAWERTCHELDRPFSRAEFAATFGRRNPEIIHFLFGDRFNNTEIADIGYRKEEYYKDAARQHGIELLPGVRKILRELQQAGFRQAIGSSAPRGNVELILQLTQIA